jgi:hypothetical protein
MYQYIFFYCVGLPNSPEMFQLIIQEHKYVCGYYYFWKIIILKAKIFFFFLQYNFCYLSISVSMSKLFAWHS